MSECQQNDHRYYEAPNNATVNPGVAFRHLKYSPINLFTDIFQSPYANTDKPEPTEPRYIRSSSRIRFTQELMDEIRSDPVTFDDRNIATGWSEYANSAFEERVREHFSSEEEEILDALLDDAIRDSE